MEEVNLFWCSLTSLTSSITSFLLFDFWSTLTLILCSWRCIEYLCLVDLQLLSKSLPIGYLCKSTLDACRWSYTTFCHTMDFPCKLSIKISLLIQKPRSTAHWLCEGVKISLHMIQQAVLSLKWALRNWSTLDLRKSTCIKLLLVGASRDNKNFSNSSFAECAVESNTWLNWSNVSTREPHWVLASAFDWW